MRSFALLAAALGAACGDSSATPDAGPDALVCSAAEMICDGACANPLTDEQNCGSCGTVCGATDACVSGTCMPKNIHCQRVREADADAPDGTYVNPATNDAFYCDFTHQVTYDDLAMAPYTMAPTDFTMLTGDALAGDATLQKMFIGLFNAAGGIRATETYTADNCCIRISPSAVLLFDGKPLTPIFEGAYTCNFIAANRIYNFSLDASAMMNRVEPPLPADYFATRPISQAAGCSEDVSPNPGLFYKKHDGLL